MDVGINFAPPAVDADSSSVSATRKKNDGSFSSDDFYKLFSKQLQNQDMMNPVDDSQFLAQMTQMAMIQAMDKMNEMTMTSYAFEFMGKDVIVAQYDANGEMQTKSGNVERVTLYNGKPQVTVGGAAYDLEQVMEVVSPTKVEASELIGKRIVVGEYDDKGAFQHDKEGALITSTGVVTKVTLYEGKTEVYIGDKVYEQTQIVEVLGEGAEATPPKPIPPKEDADKKAADTAAMNGATAEEAPGKQETAGEDAAVDQTNPADGEMQVVK